MVGVLKSLNELNLLPLAIRPFSRVCRGARLGKATVAPSTPLEPELCVFRTEDYLRP